MDMEPDDNCVLDEHFSAEISPAMDDSTDYTGTFRVRRRGQEFTVELTTRLALGVGHHWARGIMREIVRAML